MTPVRNADQATFLRTALFLGIVQGQRVVAWADHVIVHSADIPDAFIDMAMIPAGEFTALRLALLKIGTEHPSSTTVLAILGLIDRQLHTGQRSFQDTMSVLKQMRGSIRIPAEISDRVRDNDMALVLATERGDTSALEAEVRAWLATFRDADDAYDGGLAASE